MLILKSHLPHCEQDLVAGNAGWLQGAKGSLLLDIRLKQGSYSHKSKELDSSNDVNGLARRPYNLDVGAAPKTS